MCRSRIRITSVLPSSFLISFLIASNITAAAERSAYTADSVEFGVQTFPASISDNIQFTADVNLDGYTDVILTGFTLPSEERHGGNPVAILLNNGDNTFTLATGDVPMSEQAREVLVADFDGDGIADIFIADHGYDAHPFP